ncbi:hypothetical protein AX17_002176 [Amanita inopinata Kibby_2008]|nr:hypothetical protein AX17_002176 [Amanita inopinata Kibby_2008]
MASNPLTATQLISEVAPSLVPPDLQGPPHDYYYWQQQGYNQPSGSPRIPATAGQGTPPTQFSPSPEPPRQDTNRNPIRRFLVRNSPRTRLFPLPGFHKYGSNASIYLDPSLVAAPTQVASSSASVNHPSTITPTEFYFPPTPTSQTDQHLPSLAPLPDNRRGHSHILGTIPRLLYLATMFFLPYFYRSRVHQIFTGVSLTEHEIATLFASREKPEETAQLKHFDEVKRSWNEFIDSVCKEWSTLNIVSVLLLTAIYNVLQLEGTSGSALIQCTALMSLISALMSLTYGCLYIIRFETMRRPYKAMQWAWDARNISRSIWWNVFILLALPSVWLAWSLTLFLICTMAIVWKAASHTRDPHGIGPLPLSVQITVSAFLLVGLIYLVLVVSTFARYDAILDKTWYQRLKNMVNSALENAQEYPSSELESSRPESLRESITSPPRGSVSPAATVPVTPTEPLDPGPPPRSPSSPTSSEHVVWVARKPTQEELLQDPNCKVKLQQGYFLGSPRRRLRAELQRSSLTSVSEEMVASSSSQNESIGVVPPSRQPSSHQLSPKPAPSRFLSPMPSDGSLKDGARRSSPIQTETPLPSPEGQPGSPNQVASSLQPPTAPAQPSHVATSVSDGSFLGETVCDPSPNSTLVSPTPILSRRSSPDQRESPSSSPGQIIAQPTSRPSSRDGLVGDGGSSPNPPGSPMASPSVRESPTLPDHAISQSSLLPQDRSPHDVPPGSELFARDADDTMAHPVSGGESMQDVRTQEEKENNA